MIIRTKRNLILKLRYHESKNVFKSTTLYIKAKYNHIFSVVMVFGHLMSVMIFKYLPGIIYTHQNHLLM